MNTSACDTAMLLTSAYLVENHERNLVITLNSEAIDEPMLAQDDAAWLARAPVEHLEIRCHALRQANSVFIAWIIRISQAAPRARIRLTGACERVRIILTRLRIDALVELV